MSDLGMGTVVTLVAARADDLGVAAATVAAIRAPDNRDMLEPGHALDLLFNGSQAGFVQKVRAALDPLPVDFAVQPAGFSRKRLLVADMDSTIIDCEGVDELADFAGVKPQVAEITARAMRGELEFEGALRARVALLRGLSVAEVARCHRERARLNPGARTLVATMRAHGARCVLVSGGFVAFARPTAEAAGFDAYFANDLVVENGVLTGEVREPILGRAAKRERLLAECAALGLQARDAIAMGDGANDLDMITEAGLGVAYFAKPALAAAAPARIAHTDLSTALYFQGYRRADWREAEA